jgi:hypothetical protein
LAQDDGFHQSIYAKRYDAGAGAWSGAVLIGLGAFGASNPRLAVDANGNAIVVWKEASGDFFMENWANRYDAGAGAWEGFTTLSQCFYGCGVPDVAVDANGNAIAVWHQDDGPVDNIYYKRYDAQSGAWGAAELIDTGDNDAYSPQVAVDANGNAIAVWQQYNGTGTYNDIYASRWDAGAGAWGTAESIDAGVYDADSPRVAVDANGNAFAVWIQDDGTYQSIYANRWDAAAGAWAGAVLIDAGDSRAAYPRVAVDVNGNAIAVWLQEDDTYQSVYANRWE